MYTVSQFSKITGLMVKALHLYHEKGLLVPHHVDGTTGYRFYDSRDAEKARIIERLKGLSFSLEEIGEVLRDFQDDTQLLPFLERKKRDLDPQWHRLKDIADELEAMIQTEKETLVVAKETKQEIVEKQLPNVLAACVRWKGMYSETGRYLGQAAKMAGRFFAGPPFNLYYDHEYKETDADIESCFPVKAGATLRGTEIREIPGGRAVTFVHRGSYSTIGGSYEKVFAYIQSKGDKPRVPSREVYLKGPGMIFKGNPKNYLTEIQVIVGD